jgi:hypothetical protein
MAIRALCLPAGTTVDLAAAKAVATELARNATDGDLDRVLDNDAFVDIPIADVRPPVEVWTSQVIARHADALRAWTETCLHQALDTFAASLQHRDVTRFPFGRDPHTSDGGVDAYLTGGLSTGDSPTDSYTAWDVVYDTDRFPDGGVDAIGAAAGLLHPHDTGPAARTVTFHTWA